MPEIFLVPLQRQGARHPFGVAGLQQHHEELIKGNRAHGGEKVRDPIALVACKDFIQEDAGENRGDEGHKCGHQGEDEGEPERFAGTFHVPADVRQNTRLLAALLELFRRGEGEADTGEMLAELFEGILHGTGARVVQAGVALAVEAAEDHEVLEIPVDDGGLFAL